MKRRGKAKADEAYLKALGQNIEKIMKKKGYESPYDFWVRQAGDQISRASLNYIIAGSSDPKATTLRALAELLEVDPKELLNF